MPDFHVVRCTAEQSSVLTRNAWKYAKVKGKHIRIRPRTPDISVIPPGPVNYTAEIEILDSADNTWGEAEAGAQDVVDDLFADVL
jgi:hypothetical protein